MQKPHVGKSWAITLISFIVVTATPFINDHISVLGFEVTESELEHLLWVMLGVGGLGVANSGRKGWQRIKENGAAGGMSAGYSAPPPPTASPNTAYNTSYTQETRRNTGFIDTAITLPPPPQARMQDNIHAKFDEEVSLVNGNDWFKTNLRAADDQSAFLPYGTEFIVIRMDGIRSFMTGVLSRADNDQIIDIGQTGTGFYNGNDTLGIRLTDKAGNPLERGRYKIKATGDRSSSYTNSTTAEFDIR